MSTLVLKDYIRTQPDFPQPGILFYDIAPLLGCPEAWRVAIEQLASSVSQYRPSLLAAVESRGFLVASSLASVMSCGVLMVRKRGKLPGVTISHSYDLEYGSDSIEVQETGVSPGQSVVVIDDVIATGGTIAATVELLSKAGAEVKGCAVLIELLFLNGRERIDVPVKALMSYD